MEIVHKFKQNGYFTVELYNLLEKKVLTDKDVMDEIIPSVYEKEMKMSTQERLQTLSSIDVSNLVTVGDRKPGKLVLAFTPKVLVFQNYKPNDKIVAKFSIRNINNTPTHLNMIHKDSSFFLVKPCQPHALSRVAPGMSVSYTVTFQPAQYEDYTHKVLFQTDVDQYVLPLIAMGPRPLFNFPDEITVPKVPLKVESVYNLTIFNVGMVPAGFTLRTKCPFSVQPKSAYLNPNQKIVLRIGFNSMHLGPAVGILNVIFETGENFRIKLFGSTHAVSIEFEKAIVRFSDTFNTMARQQTFQITNKSEHLLTFICMKNDSVFSDFEEKLKLATIFYDVKQSESGKYRKLVQYDVLSSEDHDRVYTRIFFDEIQALIADETLFFQNMHFSVTPIKGKLWPNKTTELTVTFNPKEIGEFEAVLFFDIDGIPDRVPLKLTGTSLPPSIHLNVETLDVDCVYINTTYHYEIVAINNGHINGVITYSEVKPLFGSVISCTPEMYCLRPGDKEVFIVSFFNSNQGPFFEELNFSIRHTNILLKLYLKGTVIYPSVLFSVPCLDFGRISIGVPTALEVDIINESVVNVKGEVKISSDGPEITSYTLDDCAVLENVKLESPKWPREFKIEPRLVEIEPESKATVKVILTANLVRSNQTYLELELENSDSPPITLPVTFHALVPTITPAPDIKLRACFIDYPYHHDIVVSSNEFAGYYTIAEQSDEETLRVDIKNKRGYISPNSTVTIPARIITSELGDQEYTVLMYLFGMTQPLEICRIYGTGVRPIVTCTPMSCHWGQLKLLTRSNKVLTLCNDSPVTVYFKASLLNRDGRWAVSPAEGLIDPERQTELQLSLYLVDADTYTNKLVVHLEKVKDIFVPLSATGIGTSIVVGEYRDKMLLGRHFTRIPMSCKVTVENFGTRIHNLDWNEYYKPPKTKVVTQPFFTIEPRTFKLGAGEKTTLTITAVCNKVTTFKETWYLIGSVEGVNKKELLIECPVVAEFVDPRVEISAAFLDFRYDFGPHSEYYHITDILAIKNVSKLPLDIDINVRPPFAIIQKKTYKILSEEDDLTCGCIYYDTSDLNMQNMLKELGHQQSKHYIDYFTMKPVEPLRDGSLQFFQDIHKIKAAFNLTHAVEQRLQDLEVMKIQVLFDTTKHSTLKSKIYCDIMKIKFKGHKNKDAVKIIGKVNFPNMFVAGPKVDFKCILNGSVESKAIKIQNITPLLVSYRFQWKKVCISPAVVPQMHILDSSDQSLIKTSVEESDVVFYNELPEVVLEESSLESSAKKPRDPVSGAAKDSRFTVFSESTEEIDEETLMKTKLIRKIAPMIGYDYHQPISPWIYKLPEIIKYNYININDVLQVTPHRGLLKPNEAQHVHIIFRPTDNINVRATLECEVLGGPSELITVTGQSSDLMYRLNTNKINFKIRPFHEKASENLILTNVTSLPFDYTTYLNESKFETELGGTILEIIPPEKQLEAEEETEIKIVMRPGVLGYFNRTFLLELGHLPCVPIEVFGWGVIPQMYLSLQRPEIAKLPIEIGYQAIATLSTEYLQAIIEIFKTEDPEHLNSPQLEKCFEDPDLQHDDWHICSTWDDFPSTMDIELAIERLMVVNHIRYRPDILTGYSAGKTGSITGFYTTAYVIDFGVVITGSQVQCIADVINYGPIINKPLLAKHSKIPQWLNLKLSNKLNPGETGKIEVIFSPTPQYFPELENNVETSFYLEIPYGITLPVHIKGLCAVPYLTSNVTEIDLGTVKCGNKIIRTIPLKNVGRPTCVWYATLRLKTVGPSPMTILDSSGKYEPGEGGWLSIAFKPTMEMTYEALLIFRFHMNPNRMVIPVRGHGIMPHVHVIGPHMKFPPTLPWADTTEMYFGLTNPCPFPIELIIAHCDEKWNEEEEIYQFLLKYYNKPDEMLVPAIKPGEGYPFEIINFYKNFKETVRKAKEEETAAAQKVAAAAAKHAVPKKAKPSPRPARGKAPAVAPIGVAPDTPPKRFRTEAEIISDEIKTLKEEGHDPLEDCMRVFDQESSKTSSEKHSKGLIIFFHGSPCEEMQCQEMAYTVGKSLGIPTVNIDHCIVEALSVCTGTNKQILMTTLNETYEAAMKAIIKIGSMVQDEISEQLSVHEDEYDVILKKLEFLSTAKVAGTPRSKVTDKKKTQSSHTAMGMSSSLLPLELVQYLLIEYFSLPKFSKGFVVDSLTSMVIKVPQTVLTTVLKCKPAIRNVHLIMCQSDFAKWAQAFEESQREIEAVDECQSKIYSETEIEDIVQSFEDMDGDEFENAPQELKVIYITHGLEDRRRRHLMKTGWNPDSISKKSNKDHSRSAIPVNPSPSTKKIKKEETKAKTTNLEYALMSNKYTDYVKNVYDSILYVAANWIFEEGEIGFPLYTITGHLAGATQKKSKLKKSELQLQLSTDVVVTERGFPLTLITCSCLRYKQALVGMFKSDPVVTEALKDEETPDILKSEFTTKEYTVLMPKIMPAINHEDPLTWLFLDESPVKKCECNQITDLNLLDDSNQDNVLNILAKWHCTCGKKMTSSQTSTTDIPSVSVEKAAQEDEQQEYVPLPLRKVHAMPVLSERVVLNPGDLLRLKYTFSPTVEGNFSVKRFVEVSGWPDSREDITVSGICDLPRLDNRPKKMFANFVRRTIEDNVYKITYLDDQKLFQFGPIFVGSFRVYEEEYTFDLKNSSLLVTDVDIEFLDETSIFQIDKDFIHLEPGERGKLTISAAPHSVGTHTSVLLFCIKDNPEIVEVTFSCTGVMPALEILPQSKFLEYGKLLLYRRADDRFIIKNDSILPIMWKIDNPEDFVDNFIISQTTGIIPRYDNKVVPVTYIACNVGVIENQMLNIHIYDELGRGAPLFVDTLYLTAECYDVLVDCAYENPQENFLNFGNVKVNSSVYREMFLFNRGKYNIYFKLKKVKNFPEPSLLKTFTATPDCGVLLPTMKLEMIEFECTPTTSINLHNVPAYTCSLLDGNKDQVVVAKFPVCITIASFYNTFTLFPLGELNFHIIPVGTGVMREVTLNNTSKCPFTYEIILPPEYTIPPEELAAQSPVPSKEKNTKIKVAPLKCGNFLIVNEDNLLVPGASRVIQIQFLATAARTFQETIHFVISDTCPSESNGVPLKLVGTGALPTLDFWNIENTFREHLIVRNLDEYKVHLPAPHCVFTEDTVTLHFFSVTVNTMYRAALDLFNNGVVPSALTLKLVYQANTNQEIFYLDKYECCVEPLMHKKICVHFCPKSLQEYRAVLEIRLKTTRPDQSVYRLCMIGEGVIPRIRILSPVVRQNKLAVLNYPLTCLGSLSNKIIRLKNISVVMCTVRVHIVQPINEKRPLFWMATDETTESMVVDIDSMKTKMEMVMKPNEVARLRVTFNPLRKGRTSCDVNIEIVDNPYEHYTVLCEAEAFMEDVILIGLEMLSMEMNIDTYKSSMSGTATPGSTPKRPPTKSAPVDKKKKEKDKKSSKRNLKGSGNQSSTIVSEPSVLKYTLDFGGCELCTIQKRSVIMANNSEKVYKFTWSESDYVILKPSVGYISPGEEKDIEIIFFSATPVGICLESLNCLLIAISDDSLSMDIKGVTWDNRQTVTLFEHNKEFDINERLEKQIDEQTLMPSEDLLGIINMIVLYSATTEYSKYKCDLPEDMVLKDTFIYKTRSFTFNVENIGNVPIKITWSITIDDEYPARIDKNTKSDVPKNPPVSEGGDTVTEILPATEQTKTGSKETLFSGDMSRQSVDTWFEVDLPFKIEPDKACLKPKEKCKFKVIFSPLEAYDFKVRLTSSIDNLDPYDQNACCKIAAKALIPYVHLDIEETDYLTARRRSTGVTLPPNITVLEFNVLGSGCFKKEFSVINPTTEGYEFTFEQPECDRPELVPVHCNMLKGYVEGGTSTEVTFTFSPSAPGIYESLWKFVVTAYNLTMHLMLVGIVREADVMFDPTILIITNSLVGFESNHEVKLRNNENQSLIFEFKGNSLVNEMGKTPVVVVPEKGVLKPCSDTKISIKYTPIQDGPTSFKIFCSIAHLVKQLVLCVSSLSHSINPTVSYTLIGNMHILNSNVNTNIHFDQTASTYERTLDFKIRNDGSATFLFDWRYTNSAVKKYLDMHIEPRNGHVTPAHEVVCTLFFTLKQVPVHAFPLKLLISDGPEYNILLHANIEKPLYHFSCKDLDFGKCLVNAPESTYKRSIAFYNDDISPITLNLNFTNIPELFLDFVAEHEVKPKKRVKIPISFRPKEVKQYEFQLPFSVHSLCDEIVTVRGEGVPLLIDLYEGCQKSFDLGPVRVGEKCVRQIEVMNHSKVPIYAAFLFQDRHELKMVEKDKEQALLDEAAASEVTSICLNPTNLNLPPDTGVSRVYEIKAHREEAITRRHEIDTRNALAALKVVPARCTLKPYQKVPLKIHFKPLDIISALDIQLNVKVLRFVRPLVLLSGSATGMRLSLSQNSIQFGRVRRRGCRVMKVMLKNEGDFNTRFFWQPLIADEFTISPMYGHIDARTNVTFTITFRPKKENPFIKVWACCNVDNHKPLELAIHATCVDTGVMQIKNLFMQCPVREVATDYISIQNPTDDSWYILSEVSSGPFETLKEFAVEPMQTFNVPLHFKPKTIGNYEAARCPMFYKKEFAVEPMQTFNVSLHFKPKRIGNYEAEVLYSPLGETALFLNVVAVANHPNPSGDISIYVAAKETHVEMLPLFNLTEEPEEYVVVTEVVKTVPDKFSGYYEFKHPETVKVWGEAKCFCRWTVTVFQEGEMHLKVMFVNTKTHEYQFYNVNVAVGRSHYAGHVNFLARARESCSQQIIIRNPLNEDVTFIIECAKLDVPDQVRISANSAAKLALTYSPLVVGEGEGILCATHPLIGAFTYLVHMRCIPAKEKELTVTTPLGTCIPLRLRAQNRTKDKADFKYTICHPCIIAEKESGSLAPLEKGKFLFWFEPTNLGEQHCKVSIDSPTAGEFVYKITGIATEPKPQGPYEIKVGGFTTIVFKNVFEETRTFRIFVDREDFTWKIAPPVEPIKSKKDMKVQVYLNERARAGRAEPPTGCLTIECLEPPEPRAHWTYFLQGV